MPFTQPSISESIQNMKSCDFTKKVAVNWPIILDRLIKSVIKLDGVTEETIYSSS